MYKVARKLGSEEAKRHNFLRLVEFGLFRKIVHILSLSKQNILISPLEGEKKFLSELCELRNFREGYKKYKNSDRATKCAMTCVGEKKGKIKMNKNNLQQKQPSGLVTLSPAVSSETNHSPLTIHHSLKRKVAFTLAEVLVTLVIIGIVAVMTLPNIINNFREKQLETAFKKTNNVIMTALNETMAEYGLEGLAFKDLCPGYTTVSACRQANNSYFSEINSYFLSRFNIVRSTSNTFGNALDRKYIKVYNFMGKKVIDYGGMYGMGAGNTPWHSVNFLNDGSVVSALTFFYHGGSDGVALTFDTNGPYKGPNRFGYDIFIRTSGSWYKPCSKLEAGLEGGNYNGRGCYEYAQKDVSPDDKTKTYWKSLY